MGEKETNKPKSEKVRKAGAGNNSSGPSRPGVGCARPPRLISDCVAAGESSLDCSPIV